MEILVSDTHDYNDSYVANMSFLSHGIKPIILAGNLMEEAMDTGRSYLDSRDISKIPCASYWNKEREISQQ